MINHTFFSYTATNPTLDIGDRVKKTSFANLISSRQNWLVFAASVFLVSVPVFVEAPLVRSFPLLSVFLTGFLLLLSMRLMSSSRTYLWGDLLFGFSWTWLTGAIYWGWLRYEPIWHIPIESLGLPFALWCLRKNWGKIGNWFYLGSLLGTVLTDIYFYLVDLMPYWRQIMRTSPAGASQILQNALEQVETPWGEGWAVILALILMTVGTVSLLNKQCHWYAFGGAILSTILVDSLFLIAAVLA
ncbi:DUF3120 domain-containing protein [Dolichospermum planctonicum CS-1226]|uniref:DUF3120 domain-containing protein n=1 Tax=Dolichospermum planctonicum CS-1226 TaxID=3021751 RepID=A0ABT5AK16_9CYAN|nr:DUF3120 domain-containing protein [Dolichospermum planctonicum]MDB9537656.1 DUF3120 domain-containing protein [Dolichospermum planctonicum CS-1226]